MRPFRVRFEHFLRRLRQRNHSGLIEPLNLDEYFSTDCWCMTNHGSIDIYAIPIERLVQEWAMVEWWMDQEPEKDDESTNRPAE